jgi:hypothetical protein
VNEHSDGLSLAIDSTVIIHRSHCNFLIYIPRLSHYMMMHQGVVALPSPLAKKKKKRKTYPITLLDIVTSYSEINVLYKICKLHFALSMHAWIYHTKECLTYNWSTLFTTC